MACVLIDTNSACVHCVAVKLRLTLGGVNTTHMSLVTGTTTVNILRVSTFQVSGDDGLIISGDTSTQLQTIVCYTYLDMIKEKELKLDSSNGAKKLSTVISRCEYNLYLQET